MARGALSFTLLSSITLAACQQPTTYGPPLTGEEIHAEEMNQQRIADESRAMGGKPKPWKSRPGMAKQFERVADRVEQAGAEVCRELRIPAQDRRCYYYFDLSYNRDVNARADGESIVINAGLMRFVESDDELALAMSHELAHNLMGHPDASKHNMQVGSLVGFVVDSLASTQGVNTRGGFSDTGAEMGHLSYSVEFEEEADYVGAYIAVRAGYDVSKAASYWQRMSEAEPDLISGGADHPSNGARLAAIRKTVDEISYKRRHRLPLVPGFKQTVTSSM